jgi:hypothetical protein
LRQQRRARIVQRGKIAHDFAAEVDGHEPLQTAMFMQLVIAGHLLLFSTRASGFFFRPPFPEWKFFTAIVGTQVLAACMAAFGWPPKFSDAFGTPVDLTGGRVAWQLARASWKTDPTALITKSSLNAGEITIGAAPGNFIVHVRSADTVGLAAGSYYHEAQVTLSDSTIGTVLGGALKIRANLIAPR